MFQAIFCGDIPLHRPEKWALYMVGTSNKSVPDAWPLGFQTFDPSSYGLVTHLVK